MSGKILVTGGNGYIGRNLVRFLLEKDHFVDTLDVNERSLTNATNYFNCNITRLEELKKSKISMILLFIAQEVQAFQCQLKILKKIFLLILKQL